MTFSATLRLVPSTEDDVEETIASVARDDDGSNEPVGRVDPLERELDEALARGDEAILRALLPHVRRWLHRLLGNRPDLDDATQDALLALLDALPRFRRESKLTTYAHRVVVRVAYRYFRKRSREESLVLVPPPLDTLDPESRAIDREALRRLYRALGKLPEKRRVAFVLCCVDGLEPQEAAEIEGITAVAMRSRLFHAREEVARLLGSDPYVQALTRGKEVRP
jgi:RNA polymerase sigma-70 factor (ECF subfamily)